MPWIHKISYLTGPEKEGLCRILIAPSVYHRFRINPLTLCSGKEEKVVRFFCPEGDRTCLAEIKLPDMADPLYSIQLSDTNDFTQLDWDFLIVNDPDAPRFNTQLDQEGRDTLFGWASRNLPEEERAMDAGLFPGQVRKGLGLTREVVSVLDFFCKIFDIKSIKLEALFYHNAITYERCGFSYFSRYVQMKRIHELFQPGAELFRRLDNSTPFRKPEFAHTVRGRSWAIHDGILAGSDDELLEEGWGSPVMYRMVDKPRSMITFPEPRY
jgi:hypothetical protein